MERGKFPYAHLDIHITDDGTYYLSEIALNGGTKGAKIRRKELHQKKQDVLERLANVKYPG
jgi:ribosomal protein S6--L-glutamate ligase